MGREKCHSTPDINKWITDVSVHVRDISKSIDMEVYGHDPTFVNDYKYDSYLLDDVKSRTN